MASTLTDEDVNLPYWENLVTTRKGPQYTSKLEEGILAKAHSLFAKPSAAIEVGCEGGRWSQLLSKWGWQIVCTEINQGLVDICKKRMPTATCILVNPNDTVLPCDDKKVDMVLCIEVPPVIQADWFMDEAPRVLRKGGLLVGVCWNRNSWRGLLHHAVAPFRHGDPVWYALPYSAWREKFCSHGFAMIEEVGMCWFPFGRKSNSPLIPLAARLERVLGLTKLTRFSPLIVFIAKKD